MRLLGKGSVIALLVCAFVLLLASAAAAKRIVGTGGTNVVNGTIVRDDIFARGGNDVVWGRGGNDFLYGQRGADILQGDVGNDRLFGDALEDTLDGGPGGDRLYGGWGPDVIDAGPGNDVVDAHENDGQIDSVDCGPGRDTAIVSRKDQVFGCETVRRANIRGRIPEGTVVTTTSAGDDAWDGCCANTIRHLVPGWGGDDFLDGQAGSDVIWGNEGNDVLVGGNGRDWLLGGLDDDLLLGDEGNDRLWGGWGRDQLFGGIDDDELITIDLDPYVDEITCGEGNDRVVKRAIDQIMDPGQCERVIVVRLRR
jgi:Ca2+-binding RTX toxin-like protein